MSSIQAELISGLQARAEHQAEGCTPEWLALLSWDLLFVDGEIDRYRVHVQGCYRQWLVFRSSVRKVESSRRRIEHEYALASRLEPSWALVPQALLQTAEGPLWVCDDPGGQTLHELADGKISIDRFLRLASGAARSLGLAHGKGLLHRDIKPSNLLEDAQGTVRLTGFGVSVETGSCMPTNIGDSICGTLAYMSPEQAGRGGQQADQRSDLYALGMTFYELLTGRLPFEADDAVEWVYCHVARQPLSPRHFRDSIPVPLAQMILQLIAKNPEDRYQTACRLEADLRKCLNEWSQFQHLSAFDETVKDRRCRGVEPEFLLTRRAEYQARGAAFKRVTEGIYTSAHGHVLSGCDCYQPCGCLDKVAGLEARSGILRAQASLSRPSISISMGQESLDLVSVMKASQALSEEIVLERLIGILLTNTIVHAGAQHALLLLIKDEVPQVRARGQAHESGIATELSETTPTARHLPLSMLYTVIRTRQLIVLDDAMHSHVFAADEYFNEHQVRSILCLPLIKQGQVVGVLYLENNLAPGVFTFRRTAVLELLAGQAAISLENARLYAELTEENTRRKEIEAALRTSKATLALGQRISQSGSFRWDPGTDEAQWSDELFAVWGLPVTAVAPSLPVLEKMIHPEDLQAFSSMLARALRHSSAFEHTFRIFRPDGTLRYIELLGEPDGEQFFVGVVSDVTERKTTETSLRTARAELGRVSQATTMGELAASIAHEINQPLASIVSNASASLRWLNRDVPVVEEALAGLRDIVNDGKRAADIVRALQSLARQTPLNREPLYITDVIQQVVLLTASEIEQRHVLLYREVSEPQLTVEGDAVQLQQVILNLIMNAVDAMSDLHDRPRRLAITCNTVADEYVVVSVQDNGYGIDPEHAERVFDAFFTTKEKGMGMGLAICRSIIDAHGGMLQAFSGRSSGAVFVFTLPVVAGALSGRAVRP